MGINNTEITNKVINVTGDTIGKAISVEEENIKTVEGLDKVVMTRRATRYECYELTKEEFIKKNYPKLPIEQAEKKWVQFVTGNINYHTHEIELDDYEGDYNTHQIDVEEVDEIIEQILQDE